MSLIDDEIIEDSLTILKTHLNLKLLVLFGSHVKGEAQEFSDYDLLIVADGLNDSPIENYVKLATILHPKIQPLGISPNGLITAISELRFLFIEALESGIILYQTKDYGENLKHRIHVVKEKFSLKKLEDGWSFDVQAVKAAGLI